MPDRSPALLGIAGSIPAFDESLTVEEVRAKFIAQGNAMAQQLNASAIGDYNRAAQNWARNVEQTGKIDRAWLPHVPTAVQARFDFDGPWLMQIVETQTPLPVVDVDTLLPKFKTDIGAVGGPVAGPVLAEDGQLVAGKYYQAVSDASAIGAVWVAPDGRVFQKRAVSPWNRWWQEMR